MTATGGTQDRKTAGWVGPAFFIGLIAAVAFLMTRESAPVPPDEPDPAELVGAPLWVPGADADYLILLTSQHLRRWERRSRPSSRLMVDGFVHYSVTRWELWALEADSLRVLWRRSLREARPTIPTETAPRLLGSDGKQVWWQAGIAGATPEGVREQAPPPVGPQALDIASGLAGSGPPSAVDLRHVPGETEHTIWRYQGGSARVAAGWLGLITADEAESLRRKPERGERWPEPRAPSAGVDYRIWSAQTPRAPTESAFGGPQQRFESIRALAPDDTFRQAGWLRQADTGDVITEADGAYVLHRGAAVWQVDRIAAGDGRRRWRAELPQARLIAVLPGAGALLLAGTRDGGLVPGTQYEQLGGTVLSAIDRVSGRRTDFDLAQASLASGPAR